MKLSKASILVFFISFAATIIIVWFFSSSPKNPQQAFFREGYDFRKLRNYNPDIDAIKPGEQLEISELRDDNGEPLTASNKKLILFVAIDPLCPACRDSQDMMNDIRALAESNMISYYPVLITSNPSNVDMQKYIQTLGFEKYYRWSPESNFLPLSLSQTVTPTHFLVGKEGKVIQSWYGSSEDKNTRKRISNQISDDLLLIKNVMEAASDSF